MSCRRRGVSLAVLAACFSLPHPAMAQSVADRIDRLRDGTVRLSFRTRTGICGDGHFIGEETPDGFRAYIVSRGGFTTSVSDDVRPTCSEGPLRLALDKRDGGMTNLRAAVGVAWRAADDATDLGTVSAREAVAWLVDLAPTLRDVDDIRVAFLAAAVADSARIARRLMAAAGDKGADPELREGAMRWLMEAALGEDLEVDAERALLAIARDEGDNEDVRERAVRELGDAPRGDAVLRDLFASVRSRAVQERILREVGGSGGAETAAWLGGVALDRRQDGSLRERAIRELGETRGSGELRRLYPRLDRVKLRERVLRVVAEEEGVGAAAWLREVATDGGERGALRERAVRLLGELQRSEDLRALYVRLDEHALRERVIRILGGRGGDDDLAWLEQVVLDAGERRALRERAVRVLAEGRIETARLIRLYDRLADHDLRYRLIRIFAARADSPSLDKLEAITRDDPDGDLRRAAARRLADLRVETENR